MNDLSAYAALTYQRCDELAELSQDPTCMDRRYLSKEHQLANHQVAKWMEQAGMRVWQDAAGNQWGELKSASPHAPTLVIGSHLDTVPNGGKYDGILGVLLPLSVLQYLYDTQQSLPFTLQIVGFGDEEGTRFGATLLGSHAIAGTWQEDWADLTDSDGISLSQAMQDFGLDISRVNESIRHDINAFLEVHIEQGPVLEAQDLAVGIVNAIAGARRFKCVVTGMAGHAGTVPMTMRQDALAGAAEMILAIERSAKDFDVVATVGKLSCLSGATNVISGKTEFSIDIRSENDQQRDDAFSDIASQLSDIATRRQLQLTVVQTHSASAVQCDAQLQSTLAKAISDTHIVPYTLTSGAGHDTMAMAKICPVGMLFMRCDKGISHHPAEAIEISDIEKTMQVLLHFFTEYEHSFHQKTVKCHDLNTN
ncbi:allantoate amidohydrolase [Paraglaciecola sp.]|uniref:allantoate amidohydrolase n=1 Tax=Paraglaciecola sp. TaxID=1920173 RepID=UPI00273E9F28|nr:allantoate amidohydrolase [Paraglaciecola sp.]MDP5029425.1 allantoate amidohydrolase [Paraglaciecola sp.]